MIRPPSHTDNDDHIKRQIKLTMPPSNINSCDADNASIKSDDVVSQISECYSMMDNKTPYDHIGPILSTSIPTAIPVIETSNDLCSSGLRPSSGSSHDLTCDDSEAVSGTPEVDLTMPNKNPTTN